MSSFYKTSSHDMSDNGNKYKCMGEIDYAKPVFSSEESMCDPRVPLYTITVV